MKTNISIITCLCCILFVSCTKQQIIEPHLQQAEKILIDPTAASEKNLLFSDFIKQINYTLIPTDDEFIIGNIDKIIVTDDYMFILDSKISRAIYCIRKSGEKVFSIKKTGSGPGEYITIKDISFDDTKKELIVYCSTRQILLYYDLHGKFLHEERIPYQAARIQKIGGKIVFFSDNLINPKLLNKENFPNLFLTNNDYSIISQANFFKSPINKAIVWTSESKFSSWGDTLSIKPDHGNIIYHVTNKEVFPAYELNFGKFNIDEKYWKMSRESGMTLEKIDSYCDNAKYCESFWFNEGSDFLQFTYRQNKTLYLLLYSKKTHKMINIKSEHIVNNMDLVTSFKPVAIHDNILYCIVNSEDIYIRKKFLNGCIPSTILNAVQEFGNQVIVSIKINDF